jgi:hypothetical protein
MFTRISSFAFDLYSANEICKKMILSSFLSSYVYDFDSGASLRMSSLICAPALYSSRF